MPILRDTVVCLSGWNATQKQDLHARIQALGGAILRELDLQQVTHLLVAERKGPKYEAAVKQGIVIVSLEWLQAMEAQQSNDTSPNDRLVHSTFASCWIYAPKHLPPAAARTIRLGQGTLLWEPHPCVTHVIGTNEGSSRSDKVSLEWVYASKALGRPAEAHEYRSAGS